MAAIGTIGNQAFHWLSWCGTNYQTPYGVRSNADMADDKFRLYLKAIDCGDNKLEIPSFIFHPNTIKDPIPLHIYDNTYVVNRRSADVMFRDGLGNIVKTKLKDKIYYIGRGVLFNSVLEPLLLLVGTSHRTVNSSLRLEDLKIYCNPQVFADMQDTMNKYIITHILSGLLKEEFIYYYAYHSDMAGHKYEICVSNDIFKFFEIPKLSEEDLNQTCNGILRNNINKLKVRL